MAPFARADTYIMADPSDAFASAWHHDPEPGPTERAHLIYAHADDETIFAGGLLLAYPEWEWTLIRVVGQDANRDEQHAHAVELFRAEGVNIHAAVCVDAPDKWLTWRERAGWAAVLAQCHGEPDAVFTHGLRGEYGHPHHCAIHHIVHTLFDNVWDFYHPSGLDYEPQLMRGRIHSISTDERKRRIMETAYPDMLTALTNASPELVDAQFSGRPEFYTR